MQDTTIKASLIKAGVSNLKEFGYPAVTAENLMTDLVYRGFFRSMLEDNKGQAGKQVDTVINSLIAEIDAQP